MSKLIFDGAKFESYAQFQAVFEEYRRRNAVNGIPLHFVQQSGEKLKPGTFKGKTLDQATIDKFVYKSLALVCAQRKSNKGDGNEVNCHGRITLRFDKAKKLLLVSSFHGVHTKHPDQGISMRLLRPNQSTLRANQEKVIFEVIKKLPDNALDPVRQACEAILQQWDDDNGGVTIAVYPIDNDEIEANQVDLAQPLQTDSEPDLHQSLLNRSIDRIEPFETVEQDPIIIDDSSDDASDDDDDDIHPQFIVNAKIHAAEEPSADCTDENPIIVPKVIESQDISINDSSVNLTGTNVSIVPFAGTNDCDIEKEINNNTPIDLFNTPTEHQTQDLLEQSAHDMVTSPSKNFIFGNSNQNLSQKQPTQVSLPESMVPETQLNGCANNSWIMLHNPIVRQVNQEAPTHSNRPNDEIEESDAADNQQRKNGDVFEDGYMGHDGNNSQESKVDEPKADFHQQDEPKTTGHDGSDNGDDGGDDSMNAGEEDIIMRSQESVPADEPMQENKTDLNDICEPVDTVEHDEVPNSQIPTKKPKLSEFIDLTEDDNEPTKPMANVQSVKGGKKKEKPKFRNLQLKTVAASPLSWQPQQLPKVLKRPNEVTKKGPAVVPKAPTKVKPKGKPNNRPKSGLGSKTKTKSKPSWLEALSDENAFEYEQEPSYELKKKLKQ
ncbi:uncharacterized protein LOC129567836 [Sitodiplosis mosellana]|uniref:uncharacterized protein LOC129567836 n=1 Tax=Sitodiplosis mosellana TaxID=263140 RepID=UPI002444136C|nr:uncharacterized protein LOC129567836 [Sitodiplosis mosellana]